MTASVANYSTVGNEHELGNSIYILVATHGNGTLFSHDSFQKEDVIELYLDLGQAHPEGLLQISETKALLAFQSTTEMTAVMCLLGAAMAWHDEPIRLHICPPTSTHITDYVPARDR